MSETYTRKKKKIQNFPNLYVKNYQNFARKKTTELKQPSVPGAPLVFENSQRTSRFHERPSKRTSSLG